MKDADDRPGKPGRKAERFRLRVRDWTKNVRTFFRRQDRAKRTS